MTQHVYFAVNDGRIKIGSSIDVAARLKEIGTHLSRELILIGSVPKGETLERALHRHLRQYRIRGEWFRDCPEVRAVIEACISGRFIPPAMPSTYSYQAKRREQNDRGIDGLVNATQRTAADVSILLATRRNAVATAKATIQTLLDGINGHQVGAAGDILNNGQRQITKLVGDSK